MMRKSNYQKSIERIEKKGYEFATNVSILESKKVKKLYQKELGCKALVFPNMGRRDIYINCKLKKNKRGKWR